MKKGWIKRKIVLGEGGGRVIRFDKGMIGVYVEVRVRLLIRLEMGYGREIGWVFEG